MSLTPTTRSQETREEDSRERETYVYKPPSSFPDLPQHPDYEYRWVSMESRGEAQPANVNSRLAEGYQFVDPKEIPGLKLHINPGATAEQIRVGCSAAMRIPKYKAEARQKYWEAQAYAKQASVDNEVNSERTAFGSVASTTVVRNKGGKISVST